MLLRAIQSIRDFNPQAKLFFAGLFGYVLSLTAYITSCSTSFCYGWTTVRNSSAW